MAKKSGTCKICGDRNVKLVKSHIIPETFYGDYTSSTPVAVSDDDEYYPQRRRKGAYDTFCCGKCEMNFQDHDDFAAKYLKSIKIDSSNLKIWDEGMKSGIMFLKCPNKNLFGSFIASVVLRAHYATLDEFKDISLTATEEEKLKNIVFNKQVSGYGYFDVMPVLFYNFPEGAKGLVIPPTTYTLSDVKVVDFGVWGFKFVAYIEDGGNEIDISFGLHQASGPLIFLYSDFAASNHWDLAKKAIEKIASILD